MITKEWQKLNTLFIYFLVLIFTPLFFSVFLITNNVFELPKLVTFKILLLLLFLFIIFQFFYRPIKQANIKIYKKIIIFIVILFVFYFLNTFISSINSRLSFHGFYDRLEGLESYIYYFLFFLLSLYIFQDKKNINLSLLLVFISSILVGIYAIFQAFGLDIFTWSESTEVRVASTFGQPNALGSYLLLIIPIGVYLTLKTNNRWFKVILSLGAIVNLLALLYSYSSASWLGLIGAGIIIFAYPSFKWLKERKKIVNKLILSGSALIILLGAGYLAISNTKTGTLKTKIENAVNLNTGSTAARLDFWQAGWRAIKERPLFGYGLDTQQEVLVRYYEPGWGVHSNVNVRPSRAHNIIIDTWLTTGIIGLILFVFVWLYLFYRVIKNIREKREVILNYCLLWSFFSFLIYLQFNYWHVTAWLYFAAYYAMVLAVRQSGVNLGKGSDNNIKAQNSVEPERANSDIKLTAGNKKYLFIVARFFLVLSVLCFVIWRIDTEFNMYTTDHYWWEIRSARLNNQYFSALQLHEFIKENRPGYIYYDQQFAVLMSDWLKGFESAEFRRFGEERLLEILPRLDAGVFSQNMAQAKILSELVWGGHEQYLGDAYTSFNQLIKASPNYPESNHLYAYFLLSVDDKEEAKKQFKLALDNLPPLDSPGFNQAHKTRVVFEMINNLEGLIQIYQAEGNTAETERLNNRVEGLRQLVI